MKKYKFEVGQTVMIPETFPSYRFEYGQEVIGKILKVKAVFMDEDVEVCAVNLDGVNYCFISDCLEAVDTQSEADKDRESQIEKIKSKMHNGKGIVDRNVATLLFDAGCRILSDDEYVVKALTDEQIGEMCHTYQTYDKFGFKTDMVDSIINAVQRELGVE